MSDISPPAGVAKVQWQEDKPASDGDQKRHEPPPEKVTETYEETARGTGDRITILGIPAELMTTQVSATIGGLLSQVDQLKAKVRRYEASIKRTDDGVPEELLVGDKLMRTLDTALATVPPVGQDRQLALIVVNTYEDIRKSSGLLVANSVLADVVLQIQDSAIPAEQIGLVGGPSIAALFSYNAFKNDDIGDHVGMPVLTMADRVREIVDDAVYSVAGLDMKLSFSVASVKVEVGQDALQVIGQADHILRS